MGGGRIWGCGVNTLREKDGRGSNHLSLHHAFQGIVRWRGLFLYLAEMALRTCWLNRARINMDNTVVVVRQKQVREHVLDRLVNCLFRSSLAANSG